MASIVAYDSENEKAVLIFCILTRRGFLVRRCESRTASCGFESQKIQW